ncbi:MAG TPA: hypothetical protein PLW76_07550, partial [Clostridia bacterium]|nr:hypothetical protein [Clostridia bacterium]
MQKKFLYIIIGLVSLALIGAIASAAVVSVKNDISELRSIISIEKTSSDGLLDTYTITYSDNTKTTFTIRNGKDGTDGEDGRDGADGKDGLDGQDGRDGTDGRDGR